MSEKNYVYDAGIFVICAKCDNLNKASFSGKSNDTIKCEKCDAEIDIHIQVLATGGNHDR